MHRYHFSSNHYEYFLLTLLTDVEYQYKYKYKVFSLCLFSDIAGPCCIVLKYCLKIKTLIISYTYFNKLLNEVYHEKTLKSDLIVNHYNSQYEYAHVGRYHP